MKTYGWTAVAGAIALASLGCSSGGGNDGGNGGSGATGGGSSGSDCNPTDAACFLDGPDGVGSECLALKDNSSGDRVQLRASAIQPSAPAGLTGTFIRESVLAPSVPLARPNCFQFGEGRYNWMFDFDFSTMMVTSGGGPPQVEVGDPVDGSCFDNFMDPSFGPVDSKATSFTFDSATREVSMLYDDADDPFVIAIYIDQSLTNYTLLPTIRIEINMTLSEDRSCVGSFLPDRLSPMTSCRPGMEVPWDSSQGSFDGIITVEDADNVRISSLNQSLCVLLSQDTSRWKNENPGPDEGKCAGSPGFLDTGGLPQGDWCSDNTSGCTDSWRLQGALALSGFTINGNHDRGSGTCGN